MTHPPPHIPLPPPAPKPHPESAGVATANADPSGAHVADARPDPVDIAKYEVGTAELQVVAATAAAERVTAGAMAQSKAKGDDPATQSESDLLVAVLIARPDIGSVSDLSGQAIAIDSRYVASSGSVRTAMAAAGASEVQLIEGETRAIRRVINREAPAAVVALVSADAAETFPEIAGFKVIRIPLSPSSLRAQP
jgi:hypothetical protein